MRIAEVVANFPPYFGGIGNACLSYSTELIRNGDNVEVYTSNYPKRFYKYPQKLKVRRLNYQFKYGNAPLMLGLFKIKNFDVVHLHYPFYFGAEILLLLAKLGRIKYVVTYHMDMVGSGPTRHIFALHKRLLLSPILRNSEKIFVTSKDYADNSDLMNIRGINQKIKVVPLGVDLDRFKPRPKKMDLLVMNDIPTHAKVVLFVGGLDKPHYFKGVSILIEAFSKVHKDTHLLVVGDGDLKKVYIEQAESFGVLERVHFAGRVNDVDLPYYYNLCDIFVLPSIDKGEAFGMVLLEAMASEKVVIASNLPGVRSLVNIDKNGFLVEPNDASDLQNVLNRTLENPRKLIQLGKKGRIIAKKQYSWEVVGKQLHNELDGIAFND